MVSDDDPQPICLPCYRDQLGLDVELPPPPRDGPHELCVVCGRVTTYGLKL